MHRSYTQIIYISHMRLIIDFKNLRWFTFFILFLQTESLHFTKTNQTITFPNDFTSATIIINSDLQQKIVTYTANSKNLQTYMYNEEAKKYKVKELAFFRNIECMTVCKKDKSSPQIYVYSYQSSVNQRQLASMNIFSSEIIDYPYTKLINQCIRVLKIKQSLTCQYIIVLCETNNASSPTQISILTYSFDQVITYTSPNNSTKFSDAAWSTINPLTFMLASSENKVQTVTNHLHESNILTLNKSFNVSFIEDENKTINSIYYSANEKSVFISFKQSQFVLTLGIHQDNYSYLVANGAFYLSSLLFHKHYLTAKNNSHSFVWRDNKFEIIVKNTLKESALHPNGGSFLVKDSQNTLNAYRLCSDMSTTYNSERETCIKCSTECKSCFESSTICTSCQDTSILVNKSCSNCLSNCSLCISNCTTCISSSICMQCQDTFVISDDSSTCICSSGTSYSSKDNKCLSDKLSTLVVISIAVGVFLLASVAAILIIRRKQKKDTEHENVPENYKESLVSEEYKIDAQKNESDSQ